MEDEPATKRPRNADGGKTILSLGISVLDNILVVDAFPTPDSKIVARHQRVSGGGNAANSAVALSRLGVEVKLVSKVGADVAGSQLMEEFTREGICCDHVVKGRPGDGSTVTCTVLVHEATRSIISMPYAQRVRDLAAADVLPCMLDGVDLLHLDGRHPLAAARAAELARQRAVPVLVEAELRTGGQQPVDAEENLLALLRCAEYIVTSEHYPCSSTGKSTIEKGLMALLQAQAQNAKWAVATLGAQGCVAVRRRTELDQDGIARETWQEIRTPAWPVNVVDSTGAGDAFIAGLSYAIVNGFTLERALATACWVGAQKCKGEGCRDALPTLEQLKQAMRIEDRLR